jgi:hypothetical protein
MTPTATPYRRRHWVAVLAVGALLGLLAAGIEAFAYDCSEMECMGTGLIAAGLVPLLPLVALAALAALRVPAAQRVAGGTVAAGVATWLAAGYVDRAVNGPGPHAVATLLLVAAGVVAAPAGLVLGGTGFTRAQRVGVALGLLVLVAVTSMPATA